MRRLRVQRVALVSAIAVAVATGLVLVSGAGAAGREHAHPASFGAFRSRVFANGAELSHLVGGQPQSLSNPDDITTFGQTIFVGFQNGVGSDGTPSATGNSDSTVVEFSRSGAEIRQWDLIGKCDGLTADPQTGKLIATVNEDANSSIYLIDPNGSAVRYSYLSGVLAHGGGTDAISVYGTMVLVSASAPGGSGLPAPQADYPAVYSVTFDASTLTANASPLFSDEDFALESNIASPQLGQPEHLGLTDPDSSEVVPRFARFGGDFMLTSQGDEEQIFVSDAGAADQALHVLQLSASVDDTQWASDGWGTLYADSTDDDLVDAITGPFVPGQAYVAVTPCDEDSAPATCPGPGYPANYLGALDPWNGFIRPLRVVGVDVHPQGMLFMP
jgi:hypothetical protein